LYPIILLRVDCIVLKWEELIRRVNENQMNVILNVADSILHQTISKHIESYYENCCIFEEPNARPDDPWVKKSGIEYVSLDKEMYYFFDEENYNEEKLTKAISRSKGYYFLCALGKLDSFDHKRFDSFSEITQEDLRNFVNNLKSFYVIAYDGESFLAWEK
jgi:hypothetical protein